ncbi:hypothetical protein [Terriglobus roseus]|uniref:Uncharacterized protein n=1 Tax=Terriglobus roseus TaxID=392734 RepID=A0A1H4LQE8_9BACT|nr:hypothetical protein [Terriglobus roseus]SEB72861.1 hypothetical protein SAMN05443244_1678 [Terriglobus roseus]
MMPDTPLRYVVLCFGNYAPLLMTRQRLLQREGYAALTVRSQADFRMEICRNTVALVLLCETLSDEERRKAVLFLVEYAPDARCAVLTAPGGDRMGQDLIAIDMCNGPVNFLQTIASMLPLRSPILPISTTGLPS